MKIVFVDPPSPPGFVAFRHSHGGLGECCKTSRLKFPTLDLFHAASLLIEHGFQAEIVDSVLMDHTPEQCVKEIQLKGPTHVVFRTASGSLPHDLETALLLRGNFAGPIVFYGHHAGVAAHEISKHPAIVAVLPTDNPFSFLEFARTGSLTGAGSVEMPLDRLPVPRWELVDYKKYSYVTTQTSWGCPFRCGYCPYPLTQGAKWRVRSAAHVVAEFQALRKHYGLRFVLLRDPEFTLERKRTVELCEALIAAGTPILWGCETRLDTLDEELIDLMARAGCMRVAFGVDSVNSPTLDLMGRRAGSKDDLRSKVALLKARGLLTYGMYIIGLPEETPKSTRQLVDFSLELGTDIASFSMATPFPGTALERIGRERGFIEARDPEHLTSCVPSMRNDSMTIEEIETAYLSAKEEWKKRKPGKRAQAPLSALSSLR